MGRASLCGLLLAAAIGNTGCFKGDFAECAVLCNGNNSECPSGLTCNDGACSTGMSCAGALADAGVDTDLTVPQTLTVTTTGGGTGTITSDPAGIDCGATCTAMFDPLSAVTLTASPGDDSVVDLTGDCTTSPCTVTMDGPKAVDARFLVHGSRYWSASVSFPTDQSYEGSAIDPQGNLILADRVPDGAGNNILVLRKFANADGTLLLDKSFPFPPQLASTSLATDADGNIYLCARMLFGTATIGTTTITGVGTGTIVAMRFAGATGELDWAKTWGGDGQDSCSAIVVRGDDVFISGSTSSNDAIPFEGHPVTGDGYLARLDRATGMPEAAIPFTGNFSIRDAAISADGTKIAVVGTDSAAGMTGNCNVQISPGMNSAFIAQFNTSTLACDWSVAKRSSTTNIPAENTEVAALPVTAAFPAGGWVTTGSFQGTVNFQQMGTGISNGGTAGTWDAFLVGWNPANGVGTFQYGYGTTTASEFGSRVDVAADGSIVWAGTFSSSITLAQFAFTGTNDFWITRMTPDAAPVHDWAVKVGGAGADSITGLHLDARGTVFFTGNFNGQTLIDGEPLASQGTDGYAGSLVR